MSYVDSLNQWQFDYVNSLLSVGGTIQGFMVNAGPIQPLDLSLPGYVSTDEIFNTCAFTINGQETSVFTEWSDWSTCSVTCENGVETRTRTCESGCSTITASDLTDTRACDGGVCPSGGQVFSHWSEYSSCSDTCGEGVKSRTRTCDQGNCAMIHWSELREMVSCNEGGCLTLWGAWDSTCTGSVCTLNKQRTRICTDGPTGTAADCPGDILEEIEACGCSPSYDVVIGDEPGNPSSCMGNAYNGRYMPVGSHQSRVLYQRHTLDSNGNKVFMFYDPTGYPTRPISWRFTEENSFPFFGQPISEFDENFGALDLTTETVSFPLCDVQLTEVPPIRMNINDGNNDWIKTSMAGTYNFVGMYRDYPVYKLDKAITSIGGYEVFMFNNDWTSIDNTAAADVWQITHRQAFEDKSAERWMDFVSAETDVLNLSGVWREYIPDTQQFTSTASVTMIPVPAPPPITININANDPWYDSNLAGTYNFVQMYRSYPVYKRVGLTDTGMEAYLFNNDHTSVGRSANTWQFATGQDYEAKNHLSGMYLEDTETDVLNLSGQWYEYNINTDSFDFTASVAVVPFPAPPPITINIDADPWYEANLAGTYNFVQIYRGYPVYKRDGITVTGKEVYLFNNDWTSVGMGANIWQFSNGDSYQAKDTNSWMYITSAEPNVLNLSGTWNEYFSNIDQFTLTASLTFS